MRFRHRLKILLFRRGFSHKFVHALTLVAFVGTAVGFPLATAPTVKDHSHPFPCQDRPCGCRSAEQCWRRCCCFNTEQKLAWAKEHGVEPPAFVRLAALQEALAEQQQVEQQKAKPDCQRCGKSHGQQRCQLKTAGKQDACCKSGTGSWNVRADRLPVASEKHDVSPGRRIVIGSLAARCQGISLLWTALGGSLPPPAIVVWDFDWRLAAPLELAPNIYLAARLAPPVPPPRFLAVVS